MLNECIGEPHFWTELILKHLFFITLMDNLRRYAFLLALGRYLLPRWTVSIRDKHSGYSRRKVAQYDLLKPLFEYELANDADRRLNSKTSRKDFMTNLVEKIKMGEISMEEMTAHASTLM